MKAASFGSRLKQSPSSTRSFASRNDTVDSNISKLFDNLAADELLTAEELAQRLNIAVKTVRKWRYERVLPSDSMVKLRHQVRYRWGYVLRWLQTKEG